MEEESGTDPESAAPGRRTGHGQCGSGKGNKLTLPTGYRPRQCHPGLCHRKDLSLVSGGKTTEEFSGYTRVLTLPPQSSLSTPSSLHWLCHWDQYRKYSGTSCCMVATPGLYHCRASLLSPSHEKPQACPGALTCLHSSGGSPLPLVP